MSDHRLVLSISIFLTFAGCLSAHDDHSCRRLDAAIRYHGKTYLFMGQDSVVLDNDLGEVGIDNKNYSWGGLPRIDAALVWQGDGYPYFFEGNTYFYHSAWRSATFGPYPDKDWDAKLNLHEGLDAASNLGNASYFFKCCNYIVNEKSAVHQPASLEALGIDCDVDAAFPLSEDEMAVVKYDKLWVMCSNGTVIGPEDANAIIHLKSTRICKESEDVGMSIVEENKLESD